MGTDNEALYRAQVADLRKALEMGKAYLPVELLKQGYESLGAIEKRLNLGVGHTIVALAGGTGSGKSSTFNAISGLEFADVGVRRPTTARLASCTWSSDATELLDWLEVDTDRRISRDTALDGEDQAALNGMILLDLPDHDSVAEQHRGIVDKVLPLVDVLIWIVDPQKYADEALHAGYLRSLVGSEASMIVALNQIDTIPSGGQSAISTDLKRLLDLDGLDGVEVREISAKQGTGIAALREDLRKAVARRTMASRRLEDELTKLARTISRHVPASVETKLDGSLRAETDRYLVAAGIPAIADEISEHTAQGGVSGEPPAVKAPSLTTLSGLRGRWLERITINMREPFAKAVAAATGSAQDLHDELSKAATEIPIPWGRPNGTSRTPIIVCAIASALCVVLGLLALTGVIFTVILGVVLVAVGIVLGGMTLGLDRSYRARLRRAGRARAEEFRESAADAFGKALTIALFQPIQGVLDEHDRISALAFGVQNPPGRAYEKSDLDEQEFAESRG